VKDAVNRDAWKLHVHVKGVPDVVSLYAKKAFVATDNYGFGYKERNGNRMRHPEK
jgi:hypothetical protein